MSAVFTDTSGLLALLNPADDNHARAKEAFASLRARRAPLVFTSFVLVETHALLGRRFGLDAVRSLRADFAPLIEVVRVDEPLHDAVHVRTAVHVRSHDQPGIRRRELHVVQPARAPMDAFHRA